MIRCMLFLDPGGITKITDWEVLGRIDIENDVITTLETQGKRGTYSARIYKKRKTVWKRVKIRNFPRLAYHPWEMIRQMLNEAASQNGGKI
jgi:ssDNA-specific exonuclease RecJ